ncbi:thiamine-phosphate kinase [Thiohalobacter thiocyanaticus]|uniref:Thiamine-phosphate kinase n=1 Tax=Thiohalobacter thiocyanaticus TaxID=585455 RepID=A0A426QIL5_9GAMM|nr:AIR synthase related protein [Thiohalobacter thiocyanaticus]RRQ21599.1 hypothetical protein D6C00_06345 [Thiohalobacter thiocyanaticus]
MTKLSDLGERNLISDIVAKYVEATIGDDCAVLEREAEQIVVTTDPVPPAAAEVIAGDSDPYWKGWLLTVINASDLAASGADPLALFVAAEAPSDYSLDDFERFLMGIKDSCKIEGLAYAGGNLREGKALSAVGVAIGARRPGSVLGRQGISDGDKLVVIGEGGRFWMDAMICANGGEILDKMASPLFAPRSEGRVMRALANANLLSGAMDNSDGLLPSVSQLCNSNGLGALIDLERLHKPKGYDDVKEIVSMHYHRLWLGWGDWNIVAAVSPDKLTQLVDIAASEDTDICVCGEFRRDLSGTKLTHGGEMADSPRIDSERFVTDSWFSMGIQGYIEMLSNAYLPKGGKTRAKQKE